MPSAMALNNAAALSPVATAYSFSFTTVKSNCFYMTAFVSSKTISLSVI